LIVGGFSSEIITTTVSVIECSASSKTSIMKPYKLILFFGVGFIFGILRENLIQVLIELAILPSLYTYSLHFLRILYSPIVIGIGWIFAFYNGMIVGERYLKSTNPVKTSFLAAIFVMLVSFPIEVTVVAMNWWIW